MLGSPAMICQPASHFRKQEKNVTEARMDLCYGNNEPFINPK
jgi:hypothetical protein